MVVFLFVGNYHNFISFGYVAQVCFLQFDWDFVFNDLQFNFMIVYVVVLYFFFCSVGTIA